MASRDRGVEQFGHLAQLAGNAQPATAAAVCRLDRDGHAVSLGEGDRLAGVGDRMRGARDHRRASPGGDLAGPHLVPERPDHLGGRADPDESGVEHGLRELGVLGEEPVPGMHRLGAGPLRRGDQLRDVQVGLATGRTVQRDRLVRSPDERRPGVGVGVHGHGGQPGVVAGAHDPQRDLAAIGDQNSLELDDRWLTRVARRSTAQLGHRRPAGLSLRPPAGTASSPPARPGRPPRRAG